MPVVSAVATITSKGQITLPKAIRQALGVDRGGKVAFDLIGDRVVVTRFAHELHEDPSIRSFLTILENDIRSGRNVSSLPEDLARSMLATIGRPVDLNEDIDGDVAL